MNCTSELAVATGGAVGSQPAAWTGPAKQQHQQQQQQQRRTPVAPPVRSVDDLEEEDDDEEDDTGSQSDDNESSGTVSDCSLEEIPVWIKGEQRWISGVTEDTTCGDLIDVLMQQENVGGGGGGGGVPGEAKDYCITERWRQVEQVLEHGTKIWQIWTAWGKAQSEVKFILRRIDGSHGGAANVHGERDRDSGRGSPTGSINSAIVRRKRHRAQKSTFAWMTHGQTIHPKSSKTSIERLMKLILEQGDIIQQQLSKLRDRELQISTIEEERHRMREREHGKNYLLETYLRGLSEAADLEPNAIDSGITSEATTTASPEMDFAIEHDSDNATGSAGTADATVKEQIKLLEKIVALNKQIQREEESAVKMYDKMRRYRLDSSTESKSQLEDALEKVNASIEQGSHELQMIDESLRQSDVALRERHVLLQSLSAELNDVQAKVIMDFSKPNPVLSVGRFTETVDAPAAIQTKSNALNVRSNSSNHKPVHSYPLYTIVEQVRAPPAVASGEPATIVVSSTLPRNFQQRLVPLPETNISVHQINKFIQCSNKLGTNCNTATDDKMYPKQLFDSVVSSGVGGMSPKASPAQDDLANIGTLV